MFFMRQVLMNVAPGEKSVPSATVTSATKDALSQADGEMVGGNPNGVAVAVNGGSRVTVGGGGGVPVPNRRMRGAPQMARSPLAEPVASVIKINLTFCPASESRSMVE